MDGFQIPIGGDFSDLAKAFDSIIAAVEQMGDKIVASLERSNASMLEAVNSMNRLASGSTAAAAAQNQASSASDSTGQSFRQTAATAGSLANVVIGLQSGMTLAAKGTKVLAGINLATALTNWVQGAGGLKAAFAHIPATMKAIWDNPTFKKVAIGAGLAVAAIVSIRLAWKTASAAAHLLTSAAAAAFRAVIASARTAARAVGGVMSGIASAPGKILGSIPGLPIAGLISAAGAVALLVTQLKGASEDSAVFEDLQVGVEHFLGSAQAAKDLLGGLQKFSIKTPFTTDEVQQTAAGLLGAGVRGDVGGLTQDLAALAKNGQQLGELGDAMGKGFAKGKFQTEEMNKFLERGINLNPALQSTLGLTGKAFRDAVEKGLSFKTVTAAIKSMSSAGGQFFGLLEKRSTTFTGLISTLSSAWTDLRKAFAGPINDALKPILQAGIDNMTLLLGKAKDLGEKVGMVIREVFEIFKSGKSLDLLKAGLFVAFAGAGDLLMRGFRSALAFLGTALPPILAASFAKITDGRFWSGVSDLFSGLGKGLAAEIKSALPMADMEEIARMKEHSALLQESGLLKMGLAGNVNMGDVVKQALADGATAAAAALSAPKSEGLTAALNGMEKILADARAAVLAGMLPAGKTKTGTAIAPTPNSEGESLAEKVKKAASPAVMSLTRVGGGGVAFSSTVLNNLVSEAKRQTGYLKTIAQKVVAPPTTSTAVYTS